MFHCIIGPRKTTSRNHVVYEGYMNWKVSIYRFETRLTQRVPLLEQEMLILPEHLSSPTVFSAVHVTRPLLLCACLGDRCLSFCPFSFDHCVGCPSSIYEFWLPPFDIFQLFLCGLFMWIVESVLSFILKFTQLSSMFTFLRVFLFKFAVPKEIKVINKERKYNHYRLSAFFFSKTLSEIPLAVIQPFVYLSVIYWVANLNSVTAFFASLGVLMADVLAAQVSFILCL